LTGLGPRVDRVEQQLASAQQLGAEILAAVAEAEQDGDPCGLLPDIAQCLANLNRRSTS